MKIAIITGGFLPIPATKGGAVENLIENFMKQNEKMNNNLQLTVFSDYDEKAELKAKDYKKSNVIFVKQNVVIDSLDRAIFFIAKNILKKKNSHSYRFIVRRLSFLYKVSKYLKNEDYDKIILENHPTEYLALKWNKNYIKYAGRYYYHCHNEFPGVYGCYNIIKNTTKIFCVSQFIANQTQKYLNIESEKFAVLRNGIDNNEFNKSINRDNINELKIKYNINDDDKVLLFAGRFVPEKGIKELVSSLKYVKYKKYKLLIVGSPLNEVKIKTKYQEEVEKLIAGNNKIIFTGFVNYCDMPKIYQIADIAVLPSIWDDPAPLTVIESLTCQLPIITTNSGGIPEYAVGGSAIILERNSKLIKNLAKNIDYLLDNNEVCNQMKKKSKIASKELTLEVYYKNFVNELGVTNEK